MLLLLFILVPAIELALLLEVGSHLGTLPTLGLIAATGVVGASLARRQGLAVLGRAQDQMARGELPAGSLADGVMILVAGVFLITPGILTDAFGFLLLVPVFREVVRSVAMNRLRKAIEENRVHVDVAGMGFPSEAGPVIDVPPEPFEPREPPPPPKYKVH